MYRRAHIKTCYTCMLKLMADRITNGPQFLSLHLAGGHLSQKFIIRRHCLKSRMHISCQSVLKKTAFLDWRTLKVENEIHL